MGPEKKKTHTETDPGAGPTGIPDPAHKVLFVLTDDEAVRRIFQSRFSRSAISLIFDRPQKEVVHRLLAEPASLLVMDVCSINTFSDLLQISRRRRPPLPVITLSEPVSVRWMRRLYEKGVLCHMVKPLDRTQVGYIHDLLEKL